MLPVPAGWIAGGEMESQSSSLLDLAVVTFGLLTAASVVEAAVGTLTNFVQPPLGEAHNLVDPGEVDEFGEGE